MTVNATTPATNLKQLTSGESPVEYQMYYWEFDGSNDPIQLPTGWKPVWVEVNGSILRGNLGVGLNAELDDDYTATTDGLGNWFISFPAAYANTASAQIFAKKGGH